MSKPWKNNNTLFREEVNTTKRLTFGNIVSIKKYNQSKGYKIQILTDYSYFPINRGNSSRLDEIIDELENWSKNYLRQQDPSHVDGATYEAFAKRNNGNIGMNIKVKF